MRLRENSRSASAIATFLPRISWATRLSFCGLTRSMRVTALASFSFRSRSRARLPMAQSSDSILSLAGGTRRGWGALRLTVRRVAVERARRRELAELMANHLLGDEHRN